MLPLALLGLPLVLTLRRARRVVLAVLAAQLVVDAASWSNPMLLWSEGPGSSPLLSALLGSTAERIPVVDGLNAEVLLLAVGWLAAAAVSTWAIVRAAGREAPADP